MTITYNQISNLRIPYTRVEFDSKNAQSGALQKPYKELIIGQMLSSGTGAVDTIYSVANADKAKTLFGAGSVLHNMAQAYFTDTEVTDVSFLALLEPSSGVKATGKITIAGPATANGTLAFDIAGRRVTLAVADEDTAAEIAAALIVAINAVTSLPCTALIDGDDDDEVNLTAKAKGLVGNNIDIRVNPQDADELPAGVTVDIDVMTGGTLAPDYGDLDAILGDTHYDFIAIQNTDSGTTTDIKTLADERGGAARMIEFVAFAGNTDSVGTASTLGAANNSEFLTIMSVKSSPTPAYEIAASLMKAVAVQAMIDPSKGCQTVVLKGVKAPTLADRLTSAEQEVLLGTGIATSYVNNNGGVSIQRLITTYQTNDDGGDDEAYLDLSVLVLLARLRYDFKNRVSSKFARFNIANDNQPVAPGQEIITPSIGRAFAVAVFKDWLKAGWVEDLDQFKKDLVVERDATNVNRMNFLLPVNIVNNLLHIAAKLQFIL